ATYSGDATFTGSSGSVSHAVATADLLVTANDNIKMYGQAASDSGTVMGVGNDDGITATFASAGDDATVPGGSGRYAITAPLSDPSNRLGNYTVHETKATLIVSKARALITVTPYSVPYDGNAHTATGSAIGVFGEALSGLDLSGTTHTGAGIYSDRWSFDGG